LSDPRLRRFLHLERPRPDREPSDPAEPGPTAERFEGVERPAHPPAPAQPPPTGARLDRFGPDPGPRIELVEAEGGRQPFTRCMRCGMDSNVFATECPGCGASLDTAAQRAFNEKLWADRQADAEREARAAAERRELMERAAAEEAVQRRAMGEAIAREVGDRERRRIAAEERRWGGRGWGGLGDLDRPGGSLDATPLGIRLLRRIPDGRLQVAAAIGTVFLIFCLLVGGLAGGLRGGRGPLFGLGVGLAILFFTPPGSWRRRRGR
jgi:hypothetical protein